MNLSLYLDSKSIARHLSTIRSFYKFLLIEGIVKKDPTDLIENPKQKKKIPSVLSKKEIDLILDIELINSIDYRDKAILELMYATGLRVSELVELNIINVDFDADTIKTMGKGNKERIIPW